MKRLTAISGLLLLLLCSCSHSDGEHRRRKNVDTINHVIETGELITADTRTLVMPRFGRYWSNMKIIGLLDHGTPVQAGDSILQFDPTEVKQFIVDRQTQLETQTATLQKIRVNNDIQSKNLDASLRSEEASFELARLQLESSRFESEKTRRIRELQFRQAEIRYEKVKRNIEYTRIISKNEEKIQQIRMQQVQNMLDMAYDVLPKLTMRAPISGIFQVSQKRRSRVFLKVGDEVRVGNNLGSVPDLTWMKVNTCVNEVDYRKVTVGQQVLVRMDALPNIVYEGEVEKIGIICHRYSDSDTRKVFDVLVKLNESDRNLRPGMTVSCEFIPE